MGFIDKKFRQEIADKRQREHETRRLIAQEAVSQFCDPKNIDQIVEKTKAKVRSNYESGRTPISDITLMMHNEAHKYIADSQVCIEALMTALQSVEPATHRVDIRYYRDPDNGEGSSIVVGFEPPLA